MLVAVLVPEGLPPGAAPVGGVPLGGVPVGGVVSDVVVLVGVELSLDVAVDCAAHPAETARIIMTSRTSISVLTVVSPCTRVVRRNSLGALARALRRSGSGAYTKL
jgi:hypothetical protein